VIRLHAAASASNGRVIALRTKIANAIAIKRKRRPCPPTPGRASRAPDLARRSRPRGRDQVLVLQLEEQPKAVELGLATVDGRAVDHAGRTGLDARDECSA